MQKMSSEPSVSRTEICFEFFDQMLQRRSPSTVLGSKLKAVLYNDIFCKSPTKLNPKRSVGVAVPYYVLADDLKKDNTYLKSRVLALEKMVLARDSEVTQLADEIKKANHLKIQFLEVEHALKQKSSINKRLRKANESLMTHNEDMERELLRVVESKFDVKKLRLTVQELAKTRRHASILSTKLNEVIRKNHELVKTLNAMGKNPNSNPNQNTNLCSNSNLDSNLQSKTSGPRSQHRPIHNHPLFAKAEVTDRPFP
uniref:Uncharacterized protein n=1 Tax=Amorphochlora amoebiformis TaxID=1561963 RepID=A0A7S0H3D3_9EUKA